MPGKQITIEDWLAEIDETAAELEDAHSYYLTYGTMFAIWTQATGLPAPQWNPDCTPALRPLFRWFKSVDRTALRTAVDERIYRTAPAPYAA